MDFKDNRNATNHVYGEMGVSRLSFAVRLCSSFVHEADLEKELSTPCNPAKAITIFHVQHEIKRYYTGPTFCILPKTFQNITEMARPNMVHLAQVLFDFFSRHNNDS